MCELWLKLRTPHDFSWPVLIWSPTGLNFWSQIWMLSGAKLSRQCLFIIQTAALMRVWCVLLALIGLIKRSLWSIIDVRCVFLSLSITGFSWLLNSLYQNKLDQNFTDSQLPLTPFLVHSVRPVSSRLRSLHCVLGQNFVGVFIYTEQGVLLLHGILQKIIHSQTPVVILARWTTLRSNLPGPIKYVNVLHKHPRLLSISTVNK